MNEELRNRMDDAIRDVLATDPEASGILAGWALVTAEVAPDGHTTYGTWAPPGMPYHSQLGMLHVGLEFIQLTTNEE